MHQVTIEKQILAANHSAATANRRRFDAAGTYVLNLMSAPGAGKTALLVALVEWLGEKYRLGVIEGDIQGDDDAQRVRATGVPVVQVSTGGICHLEAESVGAAVNEMRLPSLDLLFIENVGNLVCPAEFDLGEHDKMMLLSVTEGDDKPSKYPVMFCRARVLVLNKIDLEPHTDFNRKRAIRDARQLNPELAVFSVSARTRQGIDEFGAWIVQQMLRRRPQEPHAG